MMTTTLAMMMFTFATPPSAGTWAPNGGLLLSQTFSAAVSPWTLPPWVPVAYIMAAESGGGPPATIPQLMMIGVGN